MTNGDERSATKFREDGALALEWVASYLEGVGERPVLADVEPGAIAASLPAEPPDEPEPFSAVLADLDEILLPGVTHWQSPRFFAYFATTGSEPGVLAELLIAGLNQVGILWRTSPALQELEEVTLDWLRQLLGLPAEFEGHIEDTASTGVLSALAVARSQRPDRRVVVCSEHAHSAADKAARLLELELRRVPVDDEYRLRPELLELDDACAVVATIGTTGGGAIDPVPAIAEACAASGFVAARRRGLRGVRGRLPGAPSALRRLGAGGLDRRQPAQVARRADGLLGALDAAARRVPEGLQPRPRVPALARRRGQPERGLDPARAALPRAEAVGGAALLRAERAPGADPRAPPARRAVEAWVREEPALGGRRRRHFSLVCFRRDGSDEENERLLERVNASGEVFLSHARLEEPRVAARRRQLPDDGRTTSACVGRPPSRLPRRDLGARRDGSRRRRAGRTRHELVPDRAGRGEHVVLERGLRLEAWR